MIHFKYNNTEHRYRTSRKEGELWQIIMKKALDWTNYHSKFPGNKGNTLYGDTIQEIWQKVDRDYKEYELWDTQKFAELEEKYIAPLKMK